MNKIAELEMDMKSRVANIHTKIEKHESVCAERWLEILNRVCVCIRVRVCVCVCVCCSCSRCSCHRVLLTILFSSGTVTCLISIRRLRQSCKK